MKTPLVRGIISGGQSGVDRGALDAAIGRGIPIDGWCPAGRRAEDGTIADSYSLRETPESRAAQRTSWNVYDADATLIITDAEPDGGTGYTLDVVRSLGRPHLLASSGPEAAPAIREWLASFDSAPLLNVAGPRESKAPGIGNRTRILLDNVLSDIPRGFAESLSTTLVTGAAGYLGGWLARLCPPGRRVVGNVRTARGDGDGARFAADLSNQAEVAAMLDEVSPDLIIHAAYSNVDLDRDVVGATTCLTRAAGERGIALIHCSSDMVFDGEAAPYAEDAVPGPIHPYGEAKADAERAVTAALPDAAILRFSLITSLDPPDPRSEWVLEGLRSGRPPSLFVDEIRTPIHPADLARCIWEIARIPHAERAGHWHLAGPEALSRYALGVLVAAHHRLDPAAIHPSRSRDAGTSRPRDLRLLTRRADQHLLTRPRPLSEQIIFDFQHSR